MAWWSGLQGSGDTLRNAPFTEQSVQAMLEHLGLDVHGASLRNRNVASVIVTTDLAGRNGGGLAARRHRLRARRRPVA